MRCFTVCFFVLASVTWLGCSDPVTEVVSPDPFAVTSSVEGVNLGKFDDVNAISVWQVKESSSQSLLEGLNAAGERRFEAVIDKVPDGEVTRITLSGETRCEAQVNLVTMTMIDTDCSAEQISALEIPATQLVDTFTPLVTTADQKADGTFTKAACVGAGIGAAVVTLFAWEFVVGASTVGSSTGVVPAMLVSGGSIVGAVATCYTAFAKKTSFGECVGDCDGELECLTDCTSDLISTSGAADASNYLLCLGNCEGDDCDRFCVGLFDSDD